jgi:aryl-alcohol dehydrogenase-like predicted oxidoreductase
MDSAGGGSRRGILRPMALPYVDRLILGCWQLAEGHGQHVEDGAAVLEAYYDAGFRTFDGADIYTGVEALLGRFLAAHGLHDGDVRVHTKMVPDLAALPRFDAEAVARAVDRSLSRLGVSTLDLVQFHWWDDQVPGYLEALDALVEQQRQGKVRAIGLTNFDRAHLGEILEHGLPVASIQTQYSLLDRRPDGAFTDLALAHDVDLLCYGSVAGGLLSDAWLGRPDPGGTVENRSLVKYRLVVEEIGGWPALQTLLNELRAVADERGGDVASVATAWCLERPGVRAAIVGIRSRRHLARHVALRDAAPLTAEHLARLERARSLYPEVPGEVYELERDLTGRHGRVMKFGLNEAAAS